MRQEILIGAERRRRWSDDQKLAILHEVGVDGATVADVARRHELTRQHIYQWRVELRRKGLWEPETDIAFVSIETPAPCSRSLSSGRVSAVEILLGNGRILRSVEGLSEGDLMQLIRVVERA
jgi:transposase